MSTKKIELKISIPDQHCKRKLLKTVTKLEGIDQVSVDSAKEILTLVGEVDPVLVTTQLRKNGMRAHIISVGPPKKPEEPKPKPKPKPPVVCCYPLACTCHQCQVIPVPVPVCNPPVCYPPLYYPPVCYPPYDNRNDCSIM